MGIWLRRVEKTEYGFLVTSGIYFLEIYDQLSESVAIGQKMRYFTDQNGRKRRPHENGFSVFSNSEMNVTNS